MASAQQPKQQDIGINKSQIPTQKDFDEFFSKCKSMDYSEKKGSIFDDSQVPATPAKKPQGKKVKNL